MTTTFDHIVLGLGGMGSAAAHHLAARGHRVLGLERFAPPHDRGSSHGETRVVRQAYFEHPGYVPLLRRAYDLWRELEMQTQTPLLHLCGGLMMGAPDSAVVAGSLRSAREHGLPHELLNAAEIRRRWPAFQLADDAIGLYEQSAG
jgi:sarcosine oxidase